MNAPTVLIVDDEPDVAEVHAQLIRRMGHAADVETSSDKVLEHLSRHPDVGLVLLDIRMPGLNGLDVLQQIRTNHPAVGVIMATVVNDIESAVKSTKVGAYNYLLKPLQFERLQEVMQSYLANRPPSLIGDARFSKFITGCARMKPIFQRVLQFADADVPVLVQGETGTGKELIAQILHSISPRQSKPFLPVNVAAIAPTLFESEMFGHRRGSFTGAIRDYAGYLEASGEGTLLFDEIGEMDKEQQSKLLRILQNRAYFRVGDVEERQIQCRFLFSTNCDLKQEVEKDQFREDLFYRLGSHIIDIPPLREREGDVPVLVNYFMRRYCSQYGRHLDGVEDGAMEALNAYDYPGNVRELEGAISSAVLIEEGPRITRETLPYHITHRRPSKEKGDLESTRHETIMKALASCDGNQGRAAEVLGVSRGTLNRWLKSYREKGMY
jgi:DNA-binding NtrC family response regulator